MESTLKTSEKGVVCTVLSFCFNSHHSRSLFSAAEGVAQSAHPHRTRGRPHERGSASGLQPRRESRMDTHTTMRMLDRPPDTQCSIALHSPSRQPTALPATGAPSRQTRARVSFESGAIVVGMAAGVEDTDTTKNERVLQQRKARSLGYSCRGTTPRPRGADEASSRTIS